VKVTICQTQPWLDFAKHLNQQPTSCSFMKPNGSLGFLKIPEAGDSLTWILFKYPEMANSLILLS
jgi:hypothetical protein